MAFKNKLAPSILNANFAALKEQIAAIEAGGADWVHLDIMDGHFVPNLTFGPVVVQAISRHAHLPLDCHLMVTHPEKFLPDFAKAGAHSITIHQEATHHLDSAVRAIKALGLRAGVSVNPSTPLDTLDCVLPELDLVLIMSVNPGLGGQKFRPMALEKARQLREKITALGKPIDIEMDGGIGPQNVKDVVAAGANIIVAGAAIFKSQDITDACRKMKELMG